MNRDILNETKKTYTSTRAGLKKHVDVYHKAPAGEQFSRLMAGLDPLIERANIIKMHASDIEVYGRDLHPIVGDDGIKLMVGDQQFHLTEWSLGQFSQALGVPASYAIKMAEARKYDLFLQNFESWRESNAMGKKFFVRTFDDTVRGILSERYQPVDADFLLPQMQQGLIKTNMEFMIDRHLVGPEYTNVRVISNQRIMVGDDPHYVGLKYSASDVGRASLLFEFFVFRGRCTNGMLFGKKGGILLNKTHTSKEMVREGFFQEAVHNSIGRLDELVAMTSEALRDSNRYKLTNEDVQRVMEQFINSTTFGKRNGEAVFNRLQDRMGAYGHDATLWSLSNAITEEAQEHTIDKAEEMETFAGNLLFSKLGMA